MRGAIARVNPAAHQPTQARWPGGGTPAERRPSGRPAAEDDFGYQKPRSVVFLQAAAGSRKVRRDPRRDLFFGF